MTMTLTSLRELRTAPTLSEDERHIVRQQLQPLLAACDWFTVGVMAPTGTAAISALRACEAQLGWQPLDPDPGSPQAADVPGPAFLKGNQNTGRFLLRPETGLGEGLLITGHSVANPDAEDTWGPLPLDLFNDQRA